MQDIKNEDEVIRKNDASSTKMKTLVTIRLPVIGMIKSVKKKSSKRFVEMVSRKQVKHVMTAIPLPKHVRTVRQTVWYVIVPVS